MSVFAIPQCNIWPPLPVSFLANMYLPYSWGVLAIMNLLSLSSSGVVFNWSRLSLLLFTRLSHCLWTTHKEGRCCLATWTAKLMCFLSERVYAYLQKTQIFNSMGRTLQSHKGQPLLQWHQKPACAFLNFELCTILYCKMFFFVFVFFLPTGIPDQAFMNSKKNISDLAFFSKINISNTLFIYQQGGCWYLIWLFILFFSLV